MTRLKRQKFKLPIWMCAADFKDFVCNKTSQSNHRSNVIQDNKLHYVWIWIIIYEIPQFSRNLSARYKFYNIEQVIASTWSSIERENENHCPFSMKSERLALKYSARSNYEVVLACLSQTAIVALKDSCHSNSKITEDNGEKLFAL